VTTAFRRSGSFVALTWAGNLTDPREPAFADALANRRFRTIEHAASEEVSFGWVTPIDPTGDRFAVDDLEAGAGTWLRMRLDKKSMPTAWLKMHLDAAELSKGKKLSARERRELKESLLDQMLPRVLPKTANIDALLFLDRRLLLLFATGKGARDAFTKLFAETFGAELSPLCPLGLGMRLIDDSLHATLEKLEPTRWARGGAA
jgi:DNA recombination-dependent growth factor C